MKAKLLEDQQKNSSIMNHSSQNISEFESPPIKKLAAQRADTNKIPNNLNNSSLKEDIISNNKILNINNNNINNNNNNNSIQINNNRSLNSMQHSSINKSSKAESLYSKKIDAAYAAKALLQAKCHSAEIADREERKNINLFEIDPSLSFYDSSKKKYTLKIKPEFAIKAFKRSAADVKMDNPEFLRPPRTLFNTVKYICDNIIDIDESQAQIKSNLFPKYFQYPNEPYSFKDICLFAEDRFRAIRQDFIILAPKASLECIQAHEIIARFLILSMNQCLDFKAFSGSQSLFKLLIQQLNATLTSLREFYAYNDRNLCDERNVRVLNANKAEFIAYSVMLSITDNFDLVSMMNLVTEDIRASPFIKLAEQIVRKVLSRDFIGFFKIFKNANSLQQRNEQHFDYFATCIMSLYLKDMRKSALDVISAKVEKKIFNYCSSIKYVLDLLCFENFKEFFDFLNWYGIKFPAEIREYLRYLKKIEAVEENNMHENFSETSSQKLSNCGSEGKNEINNLNNGFSYYNNTKDHNNHRNMPECYLDVETFMEIKEIFDKYDNKEFFCGEGKGAKSRFVYMEFYAETAIKDEADLFRVTNKRFIERKRSNVSRKEILVEK